MALFKLEWNPTRPQLRVFGFCATAFAAVIAVRFWYSSWPTATGLCAVVGLVFAAIAAVMPQALRWPYIAASVITAPIGWVLGHLMMSVIYFGVFTGSGLVFRMIGRDSLRLQRSASSNSYWQPRGPARPATDYLRQF